MKMHQNHTYHLVDYSPWPLTSALSIWSMMTGIIHWFHNNSMYLMSISLIIIILSTMQWWRDIIRESTFQGKHTNKVMKGLKMGMILFIISEIFFFLSFFWSFFHSSLSPTMEIGMNWPPMGIIPFNPMEILLLSTIILLSSGISVTWAHHSLLTNNYPYTYKSLLITIMLGMIFTMFQLYEF